MILDYNPCVGADYINANYVDVRGRPSLVLSADALVFRERYQAVRERT